MPKRCTDTRSTVTPQRSKCRSRGRLAEEARFRQADSFDLDAKQSTGIWFGPTLGFGKAGSCGVTNRVRRSDPPKAGHVGFVAESSITRSIAPLGV